MTFTYGSLTIFSSSVNSVSSLHRLHLFIILNFLLPCLIFSTATKCFPFLFLLNLSWTAKKLASSLYLIKSDVVYVGVSWSTMGTNTLEYSTNFHSYDLVKADFFQLVGLETTRMLLSITNPVFMFTLIMLCTYFLLVRKIMLFSYKKSSYYAVWYMPLILPWKYNNTRYTISFSVSKISFIF